jgi:hypothetical protein
MLLVGLIKGMSIFHFIFALAICLIPAYMAENRMRSGPAWFALSLILSPLICIIILFSLDTNSPDPEAAEKYAEVGRLKAEFVQLYNAHEAILSSHEYFHDTWKGATGIRAFSYEQLDAALRSAKEVIAASKNNAQQIEQLS